ncbi:hypothetical protein [Halopenitus sp. POP-27]|nr:hypothetical protein [Halopenitus sp. POP-27]
MAADVLQVDDGQDQAEQNEQRDGEAVTRLEGPNAIEATDGTVEE